MFNSTVRFPTKTNPLGLNIGERVQVKRSCKVDYDGDDRKLFYHAAPSHGIITGIVKKAIGKYVRGGESGGCLDPPQYVPAHLSVTKYIRLYECRIDTDKKPFLVHPEDISAP